MIRVGRCAVGARREIACGGTSVISRPRPELVAAVLETLGPIGPRWPRVLEPTCGRGHFLAGCSAGPDPPREIRASRSSQRIAGRPRSVLAHRTVAGAHASIACADLFGLDLGRDLTLARAGRCWSSAIRPGSPTPSWAAWRAPTSRRKWNVKGLRGLEARTGSSNFDVAEAVWLKLARELAAESPDDRAPVQDVGGAQHPAIRPPRRPAGRADASIRRIDAARWFGAAVDACLFRATIAAGQAGNVRPGRRRVPVFAGLGASEPAGMLGFARGWLVADREAYRPCARSPTATARGPGGRGSSTTPPP